MDIQKYKNLEIRAIHILLYVYMLCLSKADLSVQYGTHQNDNTGGEQSKQGDLSQEGRSGKVKCRVV